MTEDEIEYLKALSKSLNNNLGLTQIGLMNFCEAYEKRILKRLKHPNATEEHAKLGGDIIESNNKLQAQFLDLKSRIITMLDSSLIT